MDMDVSSSNWRQGDSDAGDQATFSDPHSRFTFALLSYRPDLRQVLDDAEAAPGDADLNAYAAAAGLSTQTQGGVDQAQPFLWRTSHAASTPAQAALAAGVLAWADGDLPAAALALRRRVDLRVDDLASARLLQILQLELGDFEGMVDALAQVKHRHPANGYVAGQYAFALAEVGRDEEARREAEAAVRRAQAAGLDDPWSVHALSHAVQRSGDLAAVVELVEGYRDLWARSSHFMASHAWWHAGVCWIELGRPDRALAVYDEELADRCEDCVQTLAARVSLLARLRLTGVELGQRLTALETPLLERVGDARSVFLDLHYAYGLALVGHPLAQAIAGRMSGPAGATARGLVAHGHGRFDEAARELDRAAPHISRLGGSHEQVELFDRIRRDAFMRAQAQHA